MTGWQKYFSAKIDTVTHSTKLRRKTVNCENCNLDLNNHFHSPIEQADSITDEVHYVCSWACYAEVFAKIRQEELALQRMVNAARYIGSEDPDIGAGL